MTFNIIGTGNTAWFIATRLVAGGHICNGIYGRNMEATQKLANSTASKAFELASGINDTADVCIIAISDHAIDDIVKNLSFRGTVLLHTAGAVDADVLVAAAQHYGVIWPIYSIVKDNLPVEKTIPTAWEASTETARQTILTLLPALTDMAYEADSTQRRWLHMNAVFSNNFTNHIFAIVQHLCAEKGLPFSLLQPIIRQTVDRLSDYNAEDLQTGPARRGDSPTIEKHLALLQEHPEWQQVYSQLSASIQAMYQKK